MIACAQGHDPDMWHDPAQERRAIAVCRQCPAQTQCALYALADPSLGGVWGGLTEADRRSWRRKPGVLKPLRGVAEHGTPGGWYEGCRCIRCHSSRRAMLAAGIPRKPGPGDPRHGRTAGYEAGCRCDRCRAALAASRAEYRQRTGKR